MNAIKVEKGIDMPIETERVIYPYDRMEVGDSFLVNDDTPLPGRGVVFIFVRDVRNLK